MQPKADAPGFGGGYQFGEMGFRLVDIDLFHDVSLIS